MNDINAIYAAEVQKLLHKKYIEVIRIYDLTVQMNDSLNLNDMVSTQLFLNMRKDAIIAAATIDEEIMILILSMPEERQEYMRQLMSTKWNELEIKNAAENKVVEEWERIRRHMFKTIELDKIFSKKMGGENSYYIKKEKDLL